MDRRFICLGCGKEKRAEARSAGRQAYCSAAACQRARKSAWQKQSLKTDTDHRSNQQRSQEAWRRANPGYWAGYRRRHPEKAKRNQQLQRGRDRRRRQASPAVLAKIDASAPANPLQLPENQEYWLVPVLAKMDALRVKILVAVET